MFAQARTHARTLEYKHAYKLACTHVCVMSRVHARARLPFASARGEGPPQHGGEGPPVRVDGSLIVARGFLTLSNDWNLPPVHGQVNARNIYIIIRYIYIYISAPAFSLILFSERSDRDVTSA